MEKLVGVLSAVGVLTGTIAPADSGDFMADYATDQEIIDIVNQLFNDDEGE